VKKLSEADILLPYQKAWIEDESPLKIWEKGRRIGASWTEALNSVIHTQGKKGQNTYYLSYNKDMTRQFIMDCKFWSEIVNIAAGELEEEIIEENDRAFTVYRIRFLNGREIVGLPGVGYTVRSKKGRIVLDEAAFTKEFNEIKKAALALLMWDGSYSIMSTHNGDDSDFCLLLKDIKNGKEKNWSVHRTAFNDAVKQGLYKRICLVREKEWTAEGESAWVSNIREIYNSNAEEELDVIPSRSGSKYFPYGMLASCAVGAEKFPIVRLNCKDDFMWEKPRKRWEKVKKWLEAEVIPILRNIKGLCFLGQDFARSGNLSVIWICEERGQDLDGRLIIELNNVPYDQQWEVLQCISANCNLGNAAVDSRGNGQALAEAAAQRLPCGAEMVMITRSWYAGIFQKLKSRLEDRDFQLPDDQFILSDFGIIILKNGQPAVPNEERSDRDGAKSKRHGDGAVAAALCLYAWEEGSGNAPPVIALTDSRSDTIFFGY